MEEEIGSSTLTEGQEETMTRYLNPTNDIAFRKLFGTVGHESLLMSFLNGVLNLSGKQAIVWVQLLPKDQAPVISGFKSTILDVKCQDASGNIFIVEMQNKKASNFIKRAQFYAAHNYVSQFPSSEDYEELKPIILLCIANHILFPEKQCVISYHETLDKETLEQDLKDFSYVFIELPKFNLAEEELKTLHDKWVYFFKNWNHSSEVPATIYEEELLEAYHVIEKFNWTPSEYEAYIKACIASTDERKLRQAEREEGEAEGLAKGLMQGKAEGEAEGLAKGLMQGKAEIARSSLKAGIPLATISVITGLSEKEIRSL